MAQIINIDKADTADYQQKTKVNVNFNTGLEIDKQKSTLYDATNTAEAMFQKTGNCFYWPAVIDLPIMDLKTF